MPTPRIPLTSLPRELAEAYPGSSVPYRRCYVLTLDGLLPATQENNGRWFVERADLPEVAKVLGLSNTPAQPPEAQAPHAAASAAA